MQPVIPQSMAFAARRLEQAAQQFELYFVKKLTTRIDSKNQEIDSLTRAEDVGLSIRVIQDQRLGFSFTTSLAEDAIARSIDTALQIARVMPEDPHNGLFSFSTSVYPSLEQFDTKGLEVPTPKKIELAKLLERECRSADPRITGVRAASFSETFYETHLLDSSGEHLHHQSTLFSTSISCKAEQAGDSQMGSDFAFSHQLDQIDPQAVALGAAVRATELLGAKQPKTMRCPAIIRNHVVADLLEFLSSSFSAEQIDKGRSMLAKKEGQKVLADGITLIDDGLLAGGYGTSPFDGEGVPCKKTTLIDGGFYTHALYDTYYARKFDQTPTGSAGRSIKSPPSIGISNLYMQKGKKSLNQLFEGISEGILITQLMGIHTANPVTGDFSLGASGILIENGKLTRPAKGFAIAGNILGLLASVTEIGSDLRFFGSVGAPSVRVGEISVGGS